LKSPLELNRGEGKGTNSPGPGFPHLLHRSVPSGQWDRPVSLQPSKAAFADDAQEEVVPVLEVTTVGIDPLQLLGLKPCCCCLP